YQGGTPIWSTHTVGTDASLYLVAGGSSVYSPNGQFRLSLLAPQKLHNLVEVGPRIVAGWDNVWETGTYGTPVVEAILQTDGNLVLDGSPNSDGSAPPVWASNAAGPRGDVPLAQHDALPIFYQGGTPIWSTGTVGADANLYLRPGQSVSSSDGWLRLT